MDLKLIDIIQNALTKKILLQLSLPNLIKQLQVILIIQG